MSPFPPAAVCANRAPAPPPPPPAAAADVAWAVRRDWFTGQHLNLAHDLLGPYLTDGAARAASAADQAAFIDRGWGAAPVCYEVVLMRTADIAAHQASGERCEQVCPCLTDTFLAPADGAVAEAA